MKITALRLFNVKRFAGRGVAIENIGDGVSVLCAANEFGKSTSFEALHTLFFQPHSGAPKEVKRLQPYSGGNPLIEADIVTANGRFRVAKQFIGSKRATIHDLESGRLLHQADEAENFIASLTKGGAAGPAGLLWVRQGVTGLDERDRREAEGERRVRETLLTSVQGEIEAITGGRRMAEIIDATTSELEKLVTATGRVRSGGEYEKAQAEQERLATEEKRLAGEVAALREALDTRAIHAKDLAEFEDPEQQARRRAAVEAAQSAYDAAQRQHEALKAAQAELALALAQRDAAQGHLDTFTTASSNFTRLIGDRENLEAQRADLERRRQESAQLTHTAYEAIEAADIEERENRDLLDRLDRAMQARRANEELSGLQERLVTAERTRAELERATAELALLAIPETALNMLQTLDVKLAELEAARQVSLPTLRLYYEAGADRRATLDGVPLVDGQEHGFGAAAELNLPGIGTLLLRSNQPPDRDTRLQDVRKSRADLLASIGVGSTEEARSRSAEALDKARQVEALKLSLAQLAPEGLAQLQAQIAELSSFGSEELELKGDPELVRAAISQAIQRRSEANLALREAQPARDRANEAFIAVERQLATIAGELAALETTLGPAGSRTERQASLAADHEAAVQRWTELETRAEALRATGSDMQSVEASLRRAQSVEKAAIDEIARLRLALAELNGQIRTRSEDAVEEAWNETRDALAAANARVAGFAHEVAVLRKLRDSLQAARSAARDLYLDPVVAELRPLLQLLFDDVAVVFDEQTLLPQSIRRNGLDEDVDRLSGGMREQLSVLTRLAFARLLARKGQTAPVILDDALVYSDDDRIERMFDALHRQSRDQQIIVFSCRQRAFSKLGGNVLHMTDWRPQLD